MNSLTTSLWPANSQIRTFLFDGRKLFAALVVVTFLGWAPIANAQIDFAAAVNYVTGQTPEGVASGD